MGASVGTGDGKKSLDVELNVVPFIDLMSCLTAFLLVTAVWTNLAQIKIKPKGLVNTPQETEEEPKIEASILLNEDGIYVGLSRINHSVKIERDGDDYNWPKLAEILDEHKAEYFEDRQALDIGAEDKVTYQSIITAMDYAIASGFIDVGLSQPNRLAAREALMR